MLATRARPALPETPGNHSPHPDRRESVRTRQQEQSPGTPPTTITIHYVLLDYENVQPATPKQLDAEDIRVMLFVGASQSKLSFDLAASMQSRGSRAQHVKISGDCSNALDFNIAYYIGRLAAQQPLAHFHILSNNTGFDPLIQHLKQRDVLVQRSTAIDQLPMLQTPASRDPSERIIQAVSNLRQRGTSRPRTLKTLAGTLAAHFQRQLTSAEVGELITELQRRGLVQVNQDKVSYALSEGKV